MGHFKQRHGTCPEHDETGVSHVCPEEKCPGEVDEPCIPGPPGIPCVCLRYDGGAKKDDLVRMARSAFPRW